MNFFIWKFVSERLSLLDFTIFLKNFLLGLFYYFPKNKKFLLGCGKWFSLTVEPLLVLQLLTFCIVVSSWVRSYYWILWELKILFFYYVLFHLHLWMTTNQGKGRGHRNPSLPLPLMNIYNLPRWWMCTAHVSSGK